MRCVKKHVVLIIILVMVLLLFGCGESDVQEAVNNVLTQNGLENISVSIESKAALTEGKVDSSIYETEIACDGFSHLDEETMKSVFDSVSNVGDSKHYLYPNYITIFSDGNEYTYKAGSNDYEVPTIIYCNGKMLYYESSKKSMKI